MISKGFYFSSKIEKNNGDWDFKGWDRLVGSLSNHEDDGNKNPTNLHIWQWKKVFAHALHVHFSSFDIL